MMELQERCTLKHMYPEEYDNTCPYCVARYGYKSDKQKEKNDS